MILNIKDTNIAINFNSMIYINRPSVLVMNRKTYHDIFLPKPYCEEKWNEHGVSYDAYKGVPIAICEKYNFGEVDLI